MVMRTLSCLACCLLVWCHNKVQLTEALYTKGDKVLQLTSSDFDKRVVNSNAVTLVEFYAPWCGHCKSLAPEWQKAAAALDGVVKVAAVDMDANPSVGAPFDVKGFPTIKLFTGKGNKPVDYNGARTASAIVDFALTQAKSIVNARLSGKASSSSGSSDKAKKSGSTKSKTDSSSGGSAVVTLIAPNFDAEVLESNVPVLVEFFAPWCGHCKNLAPHWEEAAKELQGTVKLGAVDATVEQALASKYGIAGYPTIKVFKVGSGGKAEDYTGGRTAADIVQYAKNLATVAAPPRNVVQLTDQIAWDTECGSTSLCIVAVLPNLLDTTANERNAQIDTLKQLAAKYKTRGFAYVWSEGGAQPEMESALTISAGNYPALAAVNAKKGRAALHIGAFSVSAIADFLKRVVNGKENTGTMDVPSITSQSQWNGKDAPKPTIADEFDIDLSDIIGSTTHEEDL